MLEAYVVEGERFFLNDTHKEYLNKLCSKIHYWEIRGNEIISKSDGFSIPNKMFDWSVYFRGIEKGNSDLLMLNSTLFYKHPWRLILSGLNVGPRNVPFAYGVVRRYRNGLTSSPKSGRNVFLSSFIVYLNALSLSLVQERLVKELSVIQNIDDSKIDISDILHCYAYSHCFEPGHKFSHAVSNLGDTDVKLRKMRSVMSEQCFSEILMSTSIIEAPNLNFLDMLKYQVISKLGVK